MEIPQGAKPNPKILLSDKEYSVEKFFISELGYLMMRLYSEENKSYTTYNLGTHNPEENIFKNLIENNNEKKR